MKKTFLIPWLMLFVPWVARAQDMSGLFSKEGIEIRADSRVFTLFAMFNGLGYDHEISRGPEPLRVPQYSQIRAAIRVGLAGKTDSFKPMQSHIQGFSGSVDSYVSKALLLGEAPDFSVSDDGDPELKSLSMVLSTYYKAEGQALFESYRSGLRDEAKRWLSQVDQLTDLARSTARVVEDEDALLDDEDLDDSKRLVLIINPLDSHGALLEQSTEETRIFVVGPVEDEMGQKSASALLAASLKPMIRPVVKRAARHFGDRQLLKAMATRGLPPGEHDATEILTEMMVSGLGQLCLQQDLKPQAPSPGLAKGAIAALGWYRQQELSFAPSAPALIGKILAIKVPEIKAPQSKAQETKTPESNEPAAKSPRIASQEHEAPEDEASDDGTPDLKQTPAIQDQDGE